MVNCLIFDLDNTLVDSSIAISARRNRNWREVYSLIPYFHLYDGIRELCDYIVEEGYRTCIVSTSPKKYVVKVVEYFNLPFKDIVGYHDAPIKPSPDSMLLALRIMRAHPLETISFGDAPNDIVASDEVGMPSAACLWGCENIEQLKMASPSFVFHTPYEVIEFLRQISLRRTT